MIHLLNILYILDFNFRYFIYHILFRAKDSISPDIKNELKILQTNW